MLPRPIKRSAVMVLGLALANIIAGDLGGADADATLPTEWLSIQTAAASSYDGSVLRLEGVSPRTMQFADRPVRLAVDVSTAEFVKAWRSGRDSLVSDPPNAGLSIVVDGSIRTATVELFSPSLDRDVLAYRVRVIEGDIPTRGGPTSLFIDEAGRQHVIIH